MVSSEKRCAICSDVVSGSMLKCPKCGSGVFESPKLMKQKKKITEFNPDSVLEGVPKIEDRGNVPAVYYIGDDVVKAGNIDLIHDAVATIKRGFRSANTQKYFFFGITGYDDDLRPLCAIPDVRQWCNTLHESIPSIFAFLHSDTMHWMLPCLCDVKIVSAQYEALQLGWPANTEGIIKNIVGDVHNMFELLCSTEGEFGIHMDDFIGRFRIATEKCGLL